MIEHIVIICMTTCAPVKTDPIIFKTMADCENPAKFYAYHKEVAEQFTEYAVKMLPSGKKLEFTTHFECVSRVTK